MTTFTDLGLATPLLRALTDEGYETPTPIQMQAIPPALEGRDILGIAQTGTGKTAAFALPILQHLAANRRPTPKRACRALVLSPTRELARQIADSFRAYGRHMGLSVGLVFGGVPHNPQARVLAKGVDILVACPGRLLDHMSTNGILLDQVECFVLDEADQMLDLGFIVPIRRIVPHLPKARRTMFFSATMPQAIASLASDLLRDPVQVAVAPVATTAERVEQRVILTDHSGKRTLLNEMLKAPEMSRALVFSRTKHGADRIVTQLEAAGIAAAAIHGNKSQGQRERALAQFRAGTCHVLVATDIAARGIDVDGVTHVVNYDLPNVPEQYVHRIGRTARAGAAGIAISLVAPDEASYLRDIEKLIRQKIPTVDRRPPGTPSFLPPPKQGQRQGHGGRPQGGRPEGHPRPHGRPHGHGQGKGQQRPNRHGGGQRHPQRASAH
ncbi:DEAD/DEAH box helicase [Elioraea rosea]|uniref:DEAD/DEAH box helicase n=1 Tax=Elioraea rosea TaxID=2492390 RepID=UPI001186B54F|nr:DEAD/DEAH box helicase [Elioraea rosea]